VPRVGICNAVQTSSTGMLGTRPAHNIARIQVKHGGQL
jgi:hypothetical protein